MTFKTTIETQDAPKAIGPYSQAVTSDGFMFVSGQLPIDPAAGRIADESIEKRAHQVFKNLQTVAEAGGTNIDRTLKTTLFLTDMSDFPRVNEVYGLYFTPPYPARSTIQVAGLPLGSDIELEAIISLD